MTAAADSSYRVKIGAWVKARLLANPAVLKIDADGLDLFVVQGVLPPTLCAKMIGLVDRYLVPSTTMMPHPDPDYRTSYSGNPPPDHPLMIDVDRRIREVVGIQAELGESVQGQRYEPGQQFKPHWDYFDTGQDYYYADVEGFGGQRTWTAMAFLNTPEAGGHTRFTEVGVTVRPRAGNLLIWNNLTPEGEVNPRSKHQGSPVEAGVKYVVTKWFRERRWLSEPED